MAKTLKLKNGANAGAGHTALCNIREGILESYCIFVINVETPLNKISSSRIRTEFMHESDFKDVKICGSIQGRTIKFVSSS